MTFSSTLTSCIHQILKMTILCNVCYDSTTLSPKQYLSGTVNVQTVNSSLIEYIIIDVIGLATNRWSYQKPFRKRFRIYRKGTPFTGHQEFFRFRHTLAGGAAPFALVTESQTFNFKAVIPEYLPATWTGTFGYIAKVMVKELNDAVKTYSTEITVKPHRDLGLEKHLLSEVLQKIERTFRFGLLNLGNVEVSIWMPLCGVAAGQCIPVLCTINNNSRIFFGGLVFVLTQIEIYRSTQPTETTRTVRQDVCRIARMVDILNGRYEYYAVLETDEDAPPTNQYYRCDCCQLVYEVWVILQGSIPTYAGFGFPNIHTPGISVIVGTKPLLEWDIEKITDNVVEHISKSKRLTLIDVLPVDKEVEEMLKSADEESDKEIERNIVRQLGNNRGSVSK